MAADPFADKQVVNDGSALLEKDWTPAEEASAKRKLDLTIMPLLMLGFFCLQLDRGNISNAITSTFFVDVGITQDQFNVGQQMLSLGIVLGEIPANMLLYRIGPGKWLSLQVVAFGLVSTFQSWQHNYGSFIATRLLLGLTESGFIPGSLYTLSTWYTKEETSKRVMVYFFGNLAASASSNLLSYGILQMAGIADKPGWFWLFVIMGLFTISSGTILALFLPDSFSQPRSWLLPRRSIFTERELYILRARVLLDDPLKVKKRQHLPLAAFKRAFTNYRLIPHVMFTLCNNGPLTAFGTYTPTIIGSYGYDRLKSNALASVGLWIQIPVAYGFSYVSDRFNIRGPVTIVAETLNVAFMIMNRFLTLSTSKEVRYGGIILTQIMIFLPHPLNVAWMSLVCRDGEERVLSSAFIIMAANAAGIYGGQIFRADDKPLYIRGFTINIAILSAALAFAIYQFVFLRITRYRNTSQEKEYAASQHSSETASDVDAEKDGIRTPHSHASVEAR